MWGEEMNSYRYSVDERPDGYDDAYQIKLPREYDFDDDLDRDWLAQECASDYHSNHNGWDYTSWNNGSCAVDLTVWKDENTKFTCEVWLEYEPRFDVRAKK
jgi:hypothetical protein